MRYLNINLKEINSKYLIESDVMPENKLQKLFIEIVPLRNSV